MKQAESCGNRVVKIWAITLAVLLVLSEAPLAFGQTRDDDTTIKNLVEKLFSAYQSEDLDGLMKLWSEKSPEVAAGKKSFQQAFEANDRIEVKSLAVRKLAVEGEKATVRVALEMGAVDAKSGKPAEGFGKKNRTLRLSKSLVSGRYGNTDQVKQSLQV